MTRAESPPEESPAAGPRRRVSLFVAGAVAAVLLGLVLGAVVARAPWATGTTTPPSVAPAVAPAGVRYEVTGGAARALVTYGHDGDVTRGNGAQLPWSDVAPLDGDGTGTYALTVQAVSDAGERITCRITVDGLVVAERTSSGRSSAVACFGEAGR
ncbi:MmpS family transport accessory protein [Actinomycetospora sp. C-140]